VKTVGVKVLKDNLSSYLRLVKAGETVLIKDRNEIIAELKKPDPLPEDNSIEAFIEREYRAGRLIKATGKAKLPHPSTVKPSGIDTQEIMDYIRGER